MDQALTKHMEPPSSRSASVDTLDLLDRGAPFPELDPPPNLLPCLPRMCAPSNVRTFILVCFVVVYMSTGAVIFQLIEGPLEKELRAELHTSVVAFLDNHAQCITSAELQAFMAEVIAANDRGITVLGNQTSQPNWSFGQSFFFAGTVLTTIGYGHVAPLSEGGKMFCIIYALVGIPLTLIMFTALVERNMIAIHKLLKCLVERLSYKLKAFYIRLLHLSIVVSVLLVVIFFIPASIFMYLEKSWNYLDSIYYCFISMTTIGLGDYIPGEQHHQPDRIVYKVLTTFYLFAGLTLMMTMLATIYEVQELNIGFHFYLKSDEEANSERMRLRRDNSHVPRYSEDRNSSPDKSTLTGHSDLDPATSIQSLEQQNDTR